MALHSRCEGCLWVTQAHCALAVLPCPSWQFSSFEPGPQWAAWWVWVTVLAAPWLQWQVASTLQCLWLSLLYSNYNIASQITWMASNITCYKHAIHSYIYIYMAYSGLYWHILRYITCLFMYYILCGTFYVTSKRCSNMFYKMLYNTDIKHAV